MESHITFDWHENYSNRTNIKKCYNHILNRLILITESGCQFRIIRLRVQSHPHNQLNYNNYLIKYNFNTKYNFLELFTVNALIEARPIRRPALSKWSSTWPIENISLGLILEHLRHFYNFWKIIIWIFINFVNPLHNKKGCVFSKKDSEIEPESRVDKGF